MTYCAYCDNTGRHYAVPSTPCSECKINETLERALKREETLQQRLNAADQRIDELEALLLRSNELFYAIQGDPGAVPSSSIDAMRGEVFTALKPAAGSTCNQVREESGLPVNAPCQACGRGTCIDR